VSGLRCAYDAAATATTRSAACSFSAAFRHGYKFTGKERDAESGLDDFEARFYSSSIGRFMQVDEFSGGPVDVFDPSPSTAGPLPYADILNPQSLNKYARVAHSFAFFANEWG
jgi:RHS repeat-associated protein